MVPLRIWSDHAESDGAEVDEKSEGDSVEDAVDGPLDLCARVPGEPIDQEREGKDSKVEGREVMVNVCDTSHGNEWEVVEEPADDGVDSRVVNLVDFRRLELHISTLPTNKVPSDDEADTDERGGGRPVDEGVAQEEVFDGYG